jgi:hypothetical protein
MTRKLVENMKIELKEIYVFHWIMLECGMKILVNFEEFRGGRPCSARCVTSSKMIAMLLQRSLIVYVVPGLFNLQNLMFF